MSVPVHRTTRRHNPEHHSPNYHRVKCFQLFRQLAYSALHTHLQQQFEYLLSSTNTNTNTIHSARRGRCQDLLGTARQPYASFRNFCPVGSMQAASVTVEVFETAIKGLMARAQYFHQLASSVLCEQAASNLVCCYTHTYYHSFYQHQVNLSMADKYGIPCAFLLPSSSDSFTYLRIFIITG